MVFLVECALQEKSVCEIRNSQNTVWN